MTVWPRSWAAPLLGSGSSATDHITDLGILLLFRMLWFWISDFGFLEHIQFAQENSTDGYIKQKHSWACVSREKKVSRVLSVYCVLMPTNCFVEFRRSRLPTVKIKRQTTDDSNCKKHKIIHKCVTINSKFTSWKQSRTNCFRWTKFGFNTHSFLEPNNFGIVLTNHVCAISN